MQLTPEIGHLTNVDTFFCPTSVLMRGVPLYYEVRDLVSDLARAVVVVVPVSVGVLAERCVVTPSQYTSVTLRERERETHY